MLSAQHIHASAHRISSANCLGARIHQWLATFERDSHCKLLDIVVHSIGELAKNVDSRSGLEPSRLVVEQRRCSCERRFYHASVSDREGRDR
jgi:hypothetical protein